MLNLIHPICYVKHLFCRCESCLKYKIYVSPLLLQSAVVEWFGSVRTFCRRKWFLTITCFRWRKYQWKRLKKRSDESNPKERLKTPCHQQCRYGTNKYQNMVVCVNWTAEEQLPPNNREFKYNSRNKVATFPLSPLLWQCLLAIRARKTLGDWLCWIDDSPTLKLSVIYLDVVSKS